MKPGNARHLGQSGTTATDRFSAGDCLPTCLVSAVAAFGLEPGCLTWLSLRWFRRWHAHGVTGLQSRRIQRGQKRSIPPDGTGDSRPDPLGVSRQSLEAPSLQLQRGAASAINKWSYYEKHPLRLDEQMFWEQRNFL